MWHCVCPNHPDCGPVPWLECVHASIHVHMSTWLCMSAPCTNQRLELQSEWEVWLDVGGGPIPWLKCVHELVHVFMSTWLSMLAKPPMDSYMERWVPVCGTVCVSQSPWLWSHTLVRMCTCINTCTYVHLTLHVCSTHQSEVGAPIRVGGLIGCGRWSHTLIKMCTWISTCIYIQLTQHGS